MAHPHQPKIKMKNIVNSGANCLHMPEGGTSAELNVVNVVTFSSKDIYLGCCGVLKLFNDIIFIFRSFNWLQ